MAVRKLWLCSLFAVACAGSEGDAVDGGGGIIILPGDRDGGPPRDGGPTVVPDAGFSDAGTPRDGGFDPNRDAGPPRDGGPPRDAGPGRDAGPPRDAGMVRDGGVMALFIGEVFGNITLNGAPIATRQDPFIDFDWGEMAPQSGVGADNFSIRWTATVQAGFTETYTFVTESDDGVRLYVDGNLIIDNFTPHGVTRDTATMMLTAGQILDVRLEYFDSGFDAVIRLLWSSPSLPEQPIAAIGSSSYDGGVRDAGPPRDAGFVRDGGFVGGGPSSTRHTARPLGSTGAGSGFYEYLPPNYSTVGAPHPLMVFWHGVGENGNGSTDLFRVLANGPPRLIADDQWPNNRPWVVLSPQHPGGGCPGVAEIQSFFAWAINNYNVDPDRVHLTGLSCGAIGSWNYLGVHLDSQVAAAVLIAGDGRNAFNNAGCNLGAVAIWGFHGTSDPTVSPQGTIQAMNNLIACPVRDDAILTTYPGVQHDSWTITYDLSAGHDIYGWLLTQFR